MSSSLFSAPPLGLSLPNSSGNLNSTSSASSGLVSFSCSASLLPSPSSSSTSSGGLFFPTSGLVDAKSTPPPPASLFPPDGFLSPGFYASLISASRAQATVGLPTLNGQDLFTTTRTASSATGRLGLISPPLMPSSLMPPPLAMPLASSLAQPTTQKSTSAPISALSRSLAFTASPSVSAPGIWRKLSGSADTASLYHPPVPENDMSPAKRTLPPPCEAHVGDNLTQSTGHGMSHLQPPAAHHASSFLPTGLPDASAVSGYPDPVSPSSPLDLNADSSNGPATISAASLFTSPPNHWYPSPQCLLGLESLLSVLPASMHSTAAAFFMEHQQYLQQKQQQTSAPKPPNHWSRLRVQHSASPSAMVDANSPTLVAASSTSAVGSSGALQYSADVKANQSTGTTGLHGMPNVLSAGLRASNYAPFGRQTICPKSCYSLEEDIKTLSRVSHWYFLILTVSLSLYD
ncbi:unnamed protein product [Protopolystoma xenopodis]|uniref:Uncharacterized protein n=1 Tax=Protopolystoma xenopodis TaxID=117903 RepID=A0A3S5A2B4_9PLAT|nr:unnamed protein product [Protopolystoma xenopodis]